MNKNDIFKIGFLYVFIFFSCGTKIKHSKLIEAESNEKIYYGKKINDPYSYIENIKDTVVSEWIKNESNNANYQLDQLSNRDNLLEKLLTFSERKSTRITNVKVTKQLEYFYLKYNKASNQYELYYRKNFDAKEEFLYSPKDYNSHLNRNYSINYINPSWDGKKVAVAMSYKGKELSDIIIVDIETKKVLPEVITQAWPRSFLGVNWLPDNSGFTYLYFPIEDMNSERFKENTFSVLYRLGEDPNIRKMIFGSKMHPKLVKSSKDFPTTKINSEEDRYIIGYLSDVTNFWEAYYVRIEDLDKKQVPWKRLYKKEDKVYRGYTKIKGDQLIFKSGKKLSNFQLAQTSLKELNFDIPKVLSKVSENEILDNFLIFDNLIFFTTIKNGIEAKLYKIINDKIENINLPNKSGEIVLKNINNKDIVLIKTRGWLNSPIDYYYKVKEKRFLERDFVPNVLYPEFKNITVEEIEVVSHDGVLVPFTIFYDKNLKKDGRNSALIQSYGAYGDWYKPFFSYRLLSYVSEGGVLAIAHVRGGGEKGEAWHKGGYKTTKSNTWKDLIACTEYLINKGFTSSKKVALFGQSAGGIGIGRAMTERPDLFGAVISQAGILNPLRFEEGGGGANYKEFGTSKDSIECMALIEMDPYLHIEDKRVNYPAILLFGGINDPRVPMWMSGKFAARLQASDTKNPVLLQVDYNSGHHGADSDYEYYKQWANIFSFAFWQTGHPDYQLKKMSK